MTSSNARFFSGPVRPVLKHGPKSRTVVGILRVEPASALKIHAWTRAHATDCEVIDHQSCSGKSINVVSVSVSSSPSSFSVFVCSVFIFFLLSPSPFSPLLFHLSFLLLYTLFHHHHHHHHHLYIFIVANSHYFIEDFPNLHKLGPASSKNIMQCLCNCHVIRASTGPKNVEK